VFSKLKYKYDENIKPPMPKIVAKIWTPKMGDFELELMVDTGFSGEVLIPYHLYDELKLTLLEVPDKYFGILPVGIPIILHTALTEVSIGELKFKVHVHSHPLISKRLAGRKLLNQLKILLNGPKKELEIL